MLATPRAGAAPALANPAPLVVWDNASRPDITKRIAIRLTGGYDVTTHSTDEVPAPLLEAARALVAVVRDGSEPLPGWLTPERPVVLVVTGRTGVSAASDHSIARNVIRAADLDTSLQRAVVSAHIGTLHALCWRRMMNRPGVYPPLRDGLGLVLSLDHRPIVSLQGIGRQVGCHPSTLARAWAQLGVSAPERAAFLRAVILQRSLLAWLQPSRPTWTEVARRAGLTLRTLESYSHEWFGCPPRDVRVIAIPRILHAMEPSVLGWLLGDAL